MLDAYCGSLSDEAQLKIALRLGKLALPVWESHFAHGEAMKIVNDLIQEKNRIQGANDKIDFHFPRRALEKIERSLINAKLDSNDRPIPVMKSDGTLSPLLATAIQPLTNPEWDRVLPQSVRLSFTSIFNILAWVLKRRRTPSNETHIYVAINQAADVLLRESILTSEEINGILSEYKDEVRGEDEESAWEKAFPVGRNEPMDQDDVLRKFLGEEVKKDQPGRTLAKELLRQMREEGKSFWDEWEEYETGTSTTYSFNKEKQSFWRHEFDVIVGSFSNHIPMTENEMLDFISQVELTALRKCKFEV
jgi:hypothetical protein